jgi:hypothetical protein
MNKPNSLKVRETTQEDITYFVNYWLDATPEFLTGMGVDLGKKPSKKQLVDLVSSQFGMPMEIRKSYFLTWLINDEPVGCSNVNQIEFGKQAFIHLHLYQGANRRKGLGTEFVKKSLPFYFEHLNLQQLFCEPYALNPAPNKTVEKIGFEFVKKYKTIPGASNFEQFVNQWRLTKKQFKKATAPQQ